MPPNPSPYTSPDSDSASINAPPVVAGNPCPMVRNGYPHSTPNIIDGNKLMNPAQNPRRVPGSAHASRTPRLAVANAARSGTRGGRRCGESRNRARASTAVPTLTAAAERNDGVQPHAASTAANPTAETTKPNWLSGPVAVVTFALRCGENQAGISRITLMNVKASPTPSTARAAYANGSAVAS